jgi:hypothetical protein
MEENYIKCDSCGWVGLKTSATEVTSEDEFGWDEMLLLCPECNECMGPKYTTVTTENDGIIVVSKKLEEEKMNYLIIAMIKYNSRKEIAEKVKKMISMTVDLCTRHDKVEVEGMIRWER